MIKNITHRELVLILLQIHQEIPSKFIKHWIKITIVKLNSYEERSNKAEKELAFYKHSFELIQKTEKKSKQYRRIEGNNFIQRFLQFCKKTAQKND